MQIVLVMETDERAQTDYMYIREVLKNYYNILDTKSPVIQKVYLGGKYNYNHSKIQRKIRNYIKAYKSVGETQVIYFFDTDDFERDADDNQFVEKAGKYCADNNFKVVWFCHDVEEVFWGRRAGSSDEKTEWATKFIKTNRVESVRKGNLSVKNLGKGKSNILVVLDNVMKLGEGQTLK